MTYLMAKANDYLLDFDKAQKNYFDFSKKFPNHPKAEIALERAVDLAEFNDQIDKATKLALEASVHTKDKIKKKNYLIKAANFQTKQGLYKSASENLRKASVLSNTRREKYQLNLDIAKNVMKYNKTSALKLINSTIYKIQVAKSNLEEIPIEILWDKHT